MIPIVNVFLTCQSMVGSLLSTATRPDVYQAAGVVAEFSSSLTEAHLTVIKAHHTIP